MLFPKTIDNTYRGQWLAIPLLVFVVGSKMVMSFNALFNTRMIIEQADKIPLSHYGADAVALIVYMFQVWAIGHFLLALLVALAIIRYRSMVPLATCFMLGEQLLRTILRRMTDLPGVTSDPNSIGVLVTRGLLAAMIVALILSLWRRKSMRAPSAAAT